MAHTMRLSSDHWLGLKGWFGQVDSRPLSLFRICFATLLLKNALYFISLAHLFYSDEGIVPRAQFWNDPAQVGLGQFSILNYVAASWLAILVFVVWAAVAMALLVGYRTRTMAVLNYLFWLSMMHRNPFILHAPDHVMMLLSFWMIFLPLNHYYSIDGWLAYRRRPIPAHGDNWPMVHATYAFPLRVIQIQVALIYSLTSYYKWQGLFWRTGDGLYYTLQQTSFLLPTGIWLGVHAPVWLLRLLTWSTLLIEVGFAPLVFAPVLQPWARAIGLLLAALLHLGIAVTMAIPDFSIVMWISYLLFFEPAWVEWLEHRVRQSLKLSPAPMMKPEMNIRRQEKRRLPLVIANAMLTILLALLLTVTIGGGFGVIKGGWSQSAAPQPTFVQAIDRQLHLVSPWSMFAYRTLPRIGWLMIDGQFENGTKQLLYTGTDLTNGRTDWLWGPGARLRFFEQRLLWSFPEPILQAWGGYYCRLYNHKQLRSAGMWLTSVEIHRHYHWVHGPGAPRNPDADDLLWSHHCLSN